ncbi:FliA/WhiG family RNA polymerase sigma factor [Bacillus sp. B15-48]|uniref:sigma-70 family RNA polymerase sigma factor n=1 Tax=Bacillus sp. B15-48 TaxID=1548601 RepID=UPI00193FF71A|nr:FliA/WhiG family RNA polymerase sigma factor [Bacillus sp. B15-48]MBM4764151.1 FliA/WhiG family RNA polymerase sigma factor [Bacillus sp. B15-48]
MNGCKDEMFDQYIPLVQKVVAQMKRKLADQADEKELFSSGLSGLWEAAQNFDSTEGVKFEVYAAMRIRYAIIDGLRQTDHASRTLRSKEKMVRKAMESLEQTLLRKPTTEEMSSYLQMERKEYEQLLLQLSFIKQVSLDRPAGEEDEGNPYFHQIEDLSVRGQDEILEEKEQKKLLAELIDGLPEREKQILSLIYYENLSFTDVSKIFEVHKSRISQLHAQAMKRLRVAAEKKGIRI